MGGWRDGGREGEGDERKECHLRGSSVRGGGGGGWESFCALVRHTGAFPNSARLVRVSCLECVFRVHASVVPPV